VGTRGDALRREIEIKKMAKEEKEWLCAVGKKFARIDIS
jgi:predicted GIY-YIG superfamily endonuclease